MINLQLLYIDPSVMTYAIQAIAGVAVAIGTVAVLLWRRAKKKVQETLHLDDVSTKETEEEVVLVDDDDE